MQANWFCVLVFPLHFSRCKESWMLNGESSLVTVLEWQIHSENHVFIVEWTLLSGNISLFTWIIIYEYMKNWEKPPNTKLTSKPWNLRNFFCLRLFHYNRKQQGTTEGNDQRVGCQHGNRIANFFCQSSLLFSLQTWWLLKHWAWVSFGLSAWSVILNYWTAKSKMWWYSNTRVKSQYTAKEVNHADWCYY